MIPVQDCKYRGPDCQTGQRGVAGPVGPGEGSLDPHQREGGTAKGTAVREAVQARAQRRTEDRVGEETT